MTDKGDAGRALEIYRAHLVRHGSGAKAVGWGSAESQRRRFEVLAGIGDIAGKSILDLGCGLGDFLAWLKSKSLQVSYLGLDITPEMVERAASAHPDARFLSGSIDVLDTLSPIPPIDYAFASGIFTYEMRLGHQAIAETVAGLFARARLGVAFNALSAAHTAKEEGEFYAEPETVMAFCRTLTPYVTLRHDYHPGDFTCYLYKDRQ